MISRRLYGLAQFPDQLHLFLRNKEHVECLVNLPEDELAGLIDYLNDVRFPLKSPNRR